MDRESAAAPDLLVRPGSVSRVGWGRQDIATLSAIVAAAVAFKILFLPAHLPPYGLIMTPAISRSVSHLIHGAWYKILLPYEYEPGRYYWPTTIILFAYAAQMLGSPLFSYLLFSSVFTVAAYVMARLLAASVALASTLAFLFAFGTQLDYLFTYGNLIALYLLLTYVAINFAMALRLVSGDQPGRRWRVGFVVTLAVVALANEMWLNYATGLLAASGFGMIWSLRHSRRDCLREARFVFAATAAILALYLAVRMQYVSEYLAPGAEEELLVTYHSGWLILDDLVANFFTLLYTTLSNYLPSFISSSNSLTYLHKAYILSQQHGYDAPGQQLVLMSHLFLWRFYAGVAAAAFVSFAIWAAVRAWRSPSPRVAILAGLALMVLTGFPTHLMIKMRPYNAVPALPYKAIISITAFTVLLAYMTDLLLRRCATARAKTALLASVWGCALLAALTRPLMQDRLLAQVGLVGAGDPLGQLLRWFH